MYGIPAYQIAKLQKVQNSATSRFVYMVPKFVNINSFYQKYIHAITHRFFSQLKLKYTHN